MRTLKASFYSCIIMLAIAVPGIIKAQHISRPVNNTGHIVFMEDAWTKALRQAKIQNKYIFVDAYATWCGPCKMLKATTFRNDKAAVFYNNNFINVAIDMEKGQGPALAQQWQLTAYPTLIIFDSNGKPVLGSVGYIKADDLIRFGKQALGNNKSR
ncbi:hypothetical protein BH09BAC6_BH09BAC6_31700 [soil metagenome]|jgi:thioredoxin 1